MLDTIPEPLRDRMEIIELQGYTEDDKTHIAERYLVPKQIEENGLTKEQIEIPEDAVRFVSRHYTREAGVRNLERNIGTICRKQARRIAEGQRPETSGDAGGGSRNSWAESKFVSIRRLRNARSVRA